MRVQYTVIVHMTSAKVDIWMPTYKPKRDHLRAAIASVFDQTERDWHLHINDQKTDTDTRSMIEDYLADERVTYRINTDHPGIGANWNDAMRHGSAAVGQFMFQDDVWRSTYLAAGLGVLAEHPDVGMVSLGHEYVFEGDVPTMNAYSEVTRTLENDVAEGRHNGMEFLLWWLERGLHPNVIGEPMFVMLRRETIERTGGFVEGMNQNLDSEYWVRALAKTNWYYLSGTYGSFRVHPSSASMTNYASGRGIFDRFFMMNAAKAALPPEHRKRADRIVKKHLATMMAKFVERYGSRPLRLRGDETPETILLRHFPQVATAVMRFALRRRKPRS